MPSFGESPWPWVVLAWSVHLALVFLVSSHVLRRRREASSALLWIVLAWSLPLLGALLYVTFGIDRVQDKGFLKHIADQKLLAARRAVMPPHPFAGHPHDPFARELNRMMDAILPDHPALAGNDIVPLTKGEVAYERMLAAIRGARSTVHLMTFMIADDAIGREFMEAMAERARAGVKVRLLYDRFGCTWSLLGGLFRRYSRVPNMQIIGWTQANPFKRQLQVNLRNHRKILVVDGTTGFLGGMNILREHTDSGGAKGIRDYHFEVRGPVVHELQYTFMKDWHFMTGSEAASLLDDESFPALGQAGPCSARLVSGGPASEMDTIEDIVFTATVAARKQVLAVTPYFVPRRDLVQAMRSAALRGVDVRLVLPEKNNHIAAGYASRALYEDLLTAGVKIYERRPPFMHAKAFIVDGEFAFIGTANLDVRSFRLDYETNLAVYGTEFVDRLKAIVYEDIAESREVTLHEWRRRPYRQHVLENLYSLMVPVL